MTVTPVTGRGERGEFRPAATALCHLVDGVGNDAVLGSAPALEPGKPCCIDAIYGCHGQLQMIVTIRRPGEIQPWASDFFFS